MNTASTGDSGGRINLAFSVQTEAVQGTGDPTNKDRSNTAEPDIGCPTLILTAKSIPKHNGNPESVGARLVCGARKGFSAQMESGHAVELSIYARLSGPK